MTKLSDFGKFLGKYAGEALSISAALRTILPALPINRDDKRLIESVIAKLEHTAESVAESAPSFKEVKVTVRKSDVEEAVAKALPAIVAAELKRLGIAEASDQGEPGNGGGASG